MQKLKINNLLKILIVMFAVFSFTESEGQQIFQKTYQYSQTSSHSGRAMIRDTSGDLFLIDRLVGYGVFGSKVSVTRTDSVGVIKWSKVYGAPNSSTLFNAIMTSTGEIIIVGQSVMVGNNKQDILIFKIDLSGNIIWWRSYENPNGDLAGVHIAEISYNNIIVTGGTSFGDSTMSEILNNSILLNIDNDGNLKWSKFFNDYLSIGFNGITATNDGGFIVTGGLKEQIPGEYDMIIIRFDSLGNFMWGNRIDGGGFEFGRKIFKALENELFIYGETKSYPPGQHTLLISIDTLGQILWMKKIQGLAFMTDIQHTIDGGYVIAGDGARLIKTDSSFNIIWQNSFGYFIGSVFTKIFPKAGGGYLCYGSTSSDMYLVQTDSTGNGGCLSSNSNVSIFSVSPIVIPFTLTDSTYSFNVDTNVIVNNINLQTTTICFTGTNVKEYIIEKIYLVYPNPAENEISIKSIESMNISKVEITDVLGRTKSYLNKDTMVDLKIDISEFNNGILFIKIFDSRGDYRVEKIVKL